MNTNRSWTITGLALAAALVLCATTAAGARADGFVDDSAFGIILGNFEPSNASDSYGAVYGSGSIFYGLVWDYALRDKIVIEGEYHYFSKSGERVNLVNGSWMPNGIAEDLSYHSLLATGKYVFRPDAGTRPFVGAGLGFYNIDVSSTAGGESFSKPGYHLVVGSHFRAQQKFSAFAQVRWSMIPGVLGDDPNSVSAYYDESDAGGLSFAVGLLYVFGN